MTQLCWIRRALLLANLGLSCCAQHCSYAYLPRPEGAKKISLLSIEELEESEQPAVSGSSAAAVESQQLLYQLYALIQRLNPADRQIITLYLEDLDAASIGEIVGISPGYAATKIHRIKRVLAERFLERRQS